MKKIKKMDALDLIILLIQVGFILLPFVSYLVYTWSLTGFTAADSNYVDFNTYFYRYVNNMISPQGQYHDYTSYYSFELNNILGLGEFNTWILKNVFGFTQVSSTSYGLGSLFTLESTAIKTLFGPYLACYALVCLEWFVAFELIKIFIRAVLFVPSMIDRRLK